MGEQSQTVERKADVIFCESPGCRSRAGDVVQLGEFAALVERILIRETMEHRGHPPREPLDSPNQPQAVLRIGIEQVVAPRVIKVLESSRK
jgi:hypothetical protein